MEKDILVQAIISKKQCKSQYDKQHSFWLNTVSETFAKKRNTDRKVLQKIRLKLMKV
jgi:hypothetical protein